MKTIQIALLFAILLSSLSACQDQESIPTPSACNGQDYSKHPKRQQYAGELEQYRLQSNSPGAIMAVQYPGQPLWIGASGWSNLEHQSAMEVCDQFRTGSITKVFVAIMVLKLKEQGKLGLDDKLADRLPETNGNIPQAGKITIRHLLTHTSGIFDHNNESLQYQLRIVSDPESVDRLSGRDMLEQYVYGKPLHFEPGTQYSYSNANYLLLGLIVEAILQKPLSAAMEDWIFKPLGLNDTYLEQRDDSNVVRGYSDFYGKGQLFDVSRWDRADTDGLASGGIISTAADLVKFAQGLFSNKLLQAATLQEMMTTVKLPSCPNGDCEYGLGLELWNTGAGIAFGHNGGSAGIEANILYFPHNGGVFCLFKNNGNGSDKRLMDRLMK